MLNIKVVSKLFLALSLISSLAMASNDLLNIESNQSDFLHVDQAFGFNFLQNEQGVKLSWQVTPEHYIYKGRISVKTEGLSIGDIHYPKAKPYYDEYFGDVEIYDQSFDLQIPLSDIQQSNIFEVTYQGCAKAGLCYPPKTQSVYINAGSASDIKPSHELTPATKLEPKAIKPDSQTAASTDESELFAWFDNLSDLQYLTKVIEEQPLIVSLSLFFLLGILLAFTPCVYPMFPILSRIIVGQGRSLSTKKAFNLSFWYVQGMAITYMILGVIAAYVGASLNATLQQPAVLIPIVILFVFLSLSMFGFYNLALPTRWQQKLNAVSDKQKSGSVFGVFIMGAISGLVCSPCATAPLIAVIGFIAQSQDMVLGGAILYILALGMGLPLLIIVTGGARLLPKAGAWMNVVKACFGFVLLAVAIVFIDRLIPVMWSSVLWFVLAITVLAYFYHQNLQSKTGVWQTLRTVVLLLALSFVAMTAYRHLFPVTQVLLPAEPVEAMAAPELTELAEPQMAHFIKVSSVAELEQQLTLAQQQGKRVMLDYYADWCVACKEFEDKTFVDVQVQAKLNNMILLQADVTKTTDENSALLQYFSVLGLPSLIFIEHQKELSNSRVTGFMATPRFLRHLNTLP